MILPLFQYVRAAVFVGSVLIKPKHPVQGLSPQEQTTAVGVSELLSSSSVDFELAGAGERR